MPQGNRVPTGTASPRGSGRGDRARVPASATVDCAQEVRTGTPIARPLRFGVTESVAGSTEWRIRNRAPVRRRAGQDPAIDRTETRHRGSPRSRMRRTRASRPSRWATIAAGYRMTVMVEDRVHRADFGRVSMPRPDTGGRVGVFARSHSATVASRSRRCFPGEGAGSGRTGTAKWRRPTLAGRGSPAVMVDRCDTPRHGRRGDTGAGSDAGPLLLSPVGRCEGQLLQQPGVVVLLRLQEALPAGNGVAHPHAIRRRRR